MDAIYRLLGQMVKEKRQGDPLECVKRQETTSDYLTLIMASEFWWRFSCRENAGNLMKSLFTADSVRSLRKAMREWSGAAFGDAEESRVYSDILDQLDRVQHERNIVEHVDSHRFDHSGLQETIERNNQTFRKIQNLSRERGVAFPPVSNEWVSLYPYKEQGNLLWCKCYRLDEDGFGSPDYIWTDCQIPRDTPAFCRGTMCSKETMQLNRLYFYHNPRTLGGVEVVSAYPFVIARMEDEQRLSYIWLYQQVLHWQNGACNGVDLMRKAWGRKDVDYIPEIAIGSEQDARNPYIRPAEPGRPIVNVYPLNLGAFKWIENKKAKDVILRLNDSLRKGVTVTYLYGTGGVGKTAVVQEMLATKQNNDNGRAGSYDYLIFLSAKKVELDSIGVVRNIVYENGHQQYADLPSLKTALRNILQKPGEAAVEDDRELYEGKKILLVLDDFETVEPEESRQEILQYLQEYFLRGEDDERRQVVITCRNTPTEGLAQTVVELRPLWRDEAALFAIKCAENIDGDRHCSYVKNLGEAYRKDEITPIQLGKRKKLAQITSGLPLLIRMVAVACPKANFESIDRFSAATMDYLKKRIYLYLSTKELKQIVALGMRLTEERNQCEQKRLQYVWDYENHSPGTPLDEMMEQLDRYGVFWRDWNGGTFGVVDEMRSSDKTISGESFAQSQLSVRRYLAEHQKEQESIISRDADKLASWLGSYHGYSIPECLLQHLQNTVRTWYTLMNCESRYLNDLNGGGVIWSMGVDEDELPKDMWLLFEQICRHPDPDVTARHSAMQLLIQVCADFKERDRRIQEDIASKLEVFLEDHWEEYNCVAEEIRLHYILYPGSDGFDEQSGDEEDVKRLLAELADYVMDKDEEMLQILYTILLLLAERMDAGYTPDDEMTENLENTLFGLESRWSRSNVIKADVQHLVDQVNRTMEAVIEKTHRIDLQSDMGNHNDSWTRSIESNADTDHPFRFFFGSAQVTE